MALMMAVMRKLPQSDRAMRAGQWPLPLGHTLYGKTLGLLGLGRVGLQVARMASAFGKQCIPHISSTGLGYVYMMHFVSALPNAMPHHEFKGLGTHVQFSCKSSPLKVIDGKIKVPTDPGLGVEFNPEYVRKHQPVSA